MKFKKIISIDYTGLEDWAREEIEELSDEVIFYEDFPKANSEIIKRIGDADGVLVSWNTPVDKEVILSCPEIKYIGMCCSLYDEKSANVDIKTARENGITVLGVRDYGDEGVIEFIISELVRLLHGFGRHQWKSEPLELTDRKLGIIGLGATGKMLAERAQSFGMKVYYFSRSRKSNLEKRGIKYLPLEELMKEVEIVSTHIPKHTMLIGKKEFETFGTGKILINTSLLPTFDIPSFENWIKKEGKYAIFDKGALGKGQEQLKEYERVLYTDKISGWTTKTKERLSRKVLENLRKFMEK